MIADYLSRTSPVDVESDLCIIGAGPAGIAIARSFIGTSVSVCLVESGGFAGEEQSQALYDGTSIGSMRFDPGSSRLRAFGGSCNVWGGGCIPLNAHDLRQRDWIPHSGWPFSFAELEPHYGQAGPFCGIGSDRFVDGSFVARPSRPPVDFDPRTLVNQNFVLSPIFFGEAYRSELERAPNVQVLLHANVLEIEASADGSHVRQARIGTLDGRKGVVRARYYVLACGGIENARLLLLSNAVAPNGLGNDRDLVGRFFMDHPSGKLGTVHTDNPNRLTRPYDRKGGKGPAPSFPELCLSDEVVRQHRILAGRVRPAGVEGPVPRGVRALRELRAALRKPQPGAHQVEDRVCAGGQTAQPGLGAGTATAANIARLALLAGLGMGDVGEAVGRKLAGQPTVKSAHVDMIGYFEQAPNRDSRVMLGDELDSLGQRKVCVDWRIGELDWHTYRTAAVLFGTELARTSAGRFQMEPWLTPGHSTVPQLQGTAHHLGTTRMSDDPQDGVVDRDCRVHGVDNLYVVGSSVFPTSGWAFPTFTVVALSLRLAGHLRMLTAGTGAFASHARVKPPAPAAAAAASATDLEDCSSNR